MPALLGAQFWNKLSQVSSSVGMNPEDLLAVMYYESGLDPAAHNANGHASGLIQFMPDTLDGLGFTGNHKDFRELDAEKQLDYVEKYVKNQMRFNGAPFKNATQYYVANLWPIALKLPGVQRGDPNQAILEKYPKTKKYPGVSTAKESGAYEANAGLDVNKDNVISYGDLDNVIKGVKNSSGYRQALNQLSNGQQYAVNKSVGQKKPQQVSLTSDFLAKITPMMNQFLAAVSEFELSNKFQKKALYKKHLSSNDFLIKINSNNFCDSIEFARILCTALDEELSADAFTYTDKNNVEVQCKIHGPHDICQESILQLCEALSDVFEEATKKIGGIIINSTILSNKQSSYQELDIKLAEINYRKFHLKFLTAQGL